MFAVTDLEDGRWMGNLRNRRHCAFGNLSALDSDDVVLYS